MNLYLYIKLRLNNSFILYWFYLLFHHVLKSKFAYIFYIIKHFKIKHTSKKCFCPIKKLDVYSLKIRMYNININFHNFWFITGLLTLRECIKKNKKTEKIKFKGLLLHRKITISIFILFFLLWLINTAVCLLTGK